MMGPAKITVILAMYWLMGIVTASYLPPAGQYSPHPSPYRKDVAHVPYQRDVPDVLKSRQYKSEELESPSYTPETRRPDVRDFSSKQMAQENPVISEGTKIFGPRVLEYIEQNCPVSKTGNNDEDHKRCVAEKIGGQLTIRRRRQQQLSRDKKSETESETLEQKYQSGKFESPGFTPETRRPDVKDFSPKKMVQEDPVISEGIRTFGPRILEYSEQYCPVSKTGNNDEDHKRCVVEKIRGQLTILKSRQQQQHRGEKSETESEKLERERLNRIPVKSTIVIMQPRPSQVDDKLKSQHEVEGLSQRVIDHIKLQCEIVMKTDEARKKCIESNLHYQRTRGH